MSLTVDAMAARRSSGQRRELATFVHYLYEQSGCATWKEFADRAGVHSVSLSDWQRGESVPDGWNLYRLIVAAQGGQESPVPLRRPTADDEIRWQLGLQTEVLEAIGGREGVLEQVKGAVRELRTVADRLEAQSRAPRPAAGGSGGFE